MYVFILSFQVISIFHHFKGCTEDDVAWQINEYGLWYRSGGVEVLIPTLKGFNMPLHKIILLSFIEYKYRITDSDLYRYRKSD